MIDKIVDFLSSEEIEAIWKYLLIILTPTIGLLSKIVYDLFSVKHKLKTTYQYEQKKSINDNYSKYKTYLIKECENLNHRLWNLHVYKDKKWNIVEENEWLNPEKYYIRSFVYRLLSFWYELYRAEQSIYSFDTNLSSKEQKLYFKYIKTMKYCFSDRTIAKALDCSVKNKNHFYKDDLVKYSMYMMNNSGKKLEFYEFEEKINEDYKPIIKVFEYVKNIDNTSDNINYTVLKCFHLLLMKFLNDYGHDYQKTSKEKFLTAIQNYKDIKNKEDYVKFLERNKILKQMKFQITKFGLSKKEIKDLIQRENAGT